MTHRILGAAVLLTLAPAAALADDFRFEVQGSYNRDMPSGDFFGDVDTTSLSGTWYFAPVSADGVPLAEAAFLGRASKLSAIAGHFDGVFNTQLNAQAAAVHYYVPGTILYASVGWSHHEDVIAVSSAITLKDYRTNWFGTVGITPLKGLLVTTNIPERDYDPNLTARYVGRLPNSHYYAGSVSIVDPEFGDTSFGLDFDYYFDDSNSVGAGYQDGSDRFEIRAQKFFSKDWAVAVSGYTADGSNGLGINVTWRH